MFILIFCSDVHITFILGKVLIFKTLFLMMSQRNSSQAVGCMRTEFSSVNFCFGRIDVGTAVMKVLSPHWPVPCVLPFRCISGHNLLNPG